MFSVSPGHVHIALYRRIKFRKGLKIPSNSNYKSLRLTYENHNWSPTNFISLTLKIIYARFSVSPGHISDAIYIQMKCKISIEILPNNNYIYLRMIYENRKGQQFILFRETPKLNFVMFSVSPGQIHIAINRKKRCEICQKISPNTYFMYLRLAYENKVKSTIHFAS